MNTTNSQKPKTCTIEPIGYVHSSEQEGRFEIEIDPAYRQALKQLDQFSHVIVLWWADRHDNPADRRILVTELPYAPGVQAGVFACRSEYRPNPIAFTIMPVIAIDEKSGIIKLPWIDAYDGTPVVDLKPYIPLSDRARSCKVADWFGEWPEWMEDAAAFFAEHEINLGG